MNASASILEKNYPINSLNIDTSRKLSLYGLLGILQDAAWEHASILGFGYEDALKKGFFWALIRLKLEMTAWPQWHNTLSLKTWTLPVSGIFATREFELFIGADKIGSCSTTWVILDPDSRKPKVLEKAELMYQPRTDHSVGFSADKIVTPDHLKALKTFEVEISDLDVNHHANNVKYAQWMMDSIPKEFHEKINIRSFMINFLAEVFLGDEIEILSNLDTTLPATDSFYFTGERRSDSKKVFSARIN